MNKKEDGVKERLLDVAMKQFLAKGYSGAATMEIARLAGVSKGALYWYFKSKEDILSAILDRYRDEFVNEAIKKTDNCTGDFPVKFRTFYRFTTEFARDNKELLLTFIAMLIEFAGTGSDMERQMKEINDQYILVFEKLIKGGIQDGSVSKETDPILYSRFVGATLIGSHVQWYLHGDDPDFGKRFAIMQRDELLKILTSRDLSSPGIPFKAEADYGKKKHGE